MSKVHTVDDLTIIAMVGKGTQGGKVYLVKDIATKEVYTLKAIRKSKIQEKNKAQYIFSERSLLIELSHPFIIKLIATFQNESKLYFMLEHCPGGDMSTLLRRAHTLSEDQAKFYAAQILLALEYMHSKNVVYRDLKPENILIDQDGYIRVTDFGLSKKAVNMDAEKHSIFGSPEYMPPEVLRQDESGKAIDFWAFGCLIHEMLTNQLPFYSQNHIEMIENIKYKPLKFNSSEVSHNCQLLLQGLLKKDPKARLGSQNIDQIKQMAWFSTVNWEALLNKNIKAPFVPIIKEKTDYSYFNREFVQMKQTLTESLVNPSLENTNAFSGFTYTGSIQTRNQASPS